MNNSYKNHVLLTFASTLFYKIMPNFCRPQTMPIHKIQRFLWSPLIFFERTKIILLYLQVKNSTYDPTDINLHI